MLLSLLHCIQAGVGGSEGKTTKDFYSATDTVSQNLVPDSCGKGYDGLRISVNNASQGQATHGAAFIPSSRVPVSALANHYDRLPVEPKKKIPWP